MPSQFLGINTGLTGLYTASSCLNTTANNVSNAETAGYSRQQVKIEANQALKVNQTYGCVGTGSSVKDIARVRDDFYDEKYRHNECKLGEADVKTYYNNLIENFLTDDGQVGFSSLFTKFKLSIEDIIDNGDSNSKLAFLGSLEQLTDYFNDIKENFNSLVKDTNEEIRMNTNHINGCLEEIATLNKQINTLELKGGKSNELRDKRDLILDDLSSYMNIETKETQNGMISNFRLTVNGLCLVENESTFKLDTKEENGLTNVYTKDNEKVTFTSGKMKGLTDIRDGNGKTSYQGIPYYINETDKWIKQFTELVNSTFENGFSNNGQDGTKILSTDDFKVLDSVMKNPDSLATKLDKTSGASDFSNLNLLKEKLEEEQFENIKPKDFLEKMLIDISTNTSNSKIKAETYGALKNTIVNNRLSVSGVDMDEEAANLMKFQNYYALNAKIIQTFSEVYDRLILYTGV